MNVLHAVYVCSKFSEVQMEIKVHRTVFLIICKELRKNLHCIAIAGIGAAATDDCIDACAAAHLHIYDGIEAADTYKLNDR